MWHRGYKQTVIFWTPLMLHKAADREIFRTHGELYVLYKTQKDCNFLTEVTTGPYFELRKISHYHYNQVSSFQQSALDHILILHISQFLPLGSVNLLSVVTSGQDHDLLHISR